MCPTETARGTATAMEHELRAVATDKEMDIQQRIPATTTTSTSTSTHQIKDASESEREREREWEEDPSNSDGSAVSPQLEREARERRQRRRCRSTYNVVRRVRYFTSFHIDNVPGDFVIITRGGGGGGDTRTQTIHPQSMTPCVWKTNQRQNERQVIRAEAITDVTATTTATVTNQAKQHQRSQLQAQAKQ